MPDPITHSVVKLFLVAAVIGSASYYIGNYFGKSILFARAPSFEKAITLPPTLCTIEVPTLSTLGVDRGVVYIYKGIMHAELHGLAERSHIRAEFYADDPLGEFLLSRSKTGAYTSLSRDWRLHATRDKVVAALRMQYGRCTPWIAVEPSRFELVPKVPDNTKKTT